MAEIPVYTGDVANFLKVRPSTVANWRRNGKGPPYTRVGNRVIYFLTDVEIWLRNKQEDPAEAIEPPPEPIPAPKPARRPKAGGW